MVMDSIQLLIAFVGFVYWPLLYMHLKDLSQTKFTKKVIALSLALAFVATFVTFIINYAYQATQLTAALVLVPVILLLTIKKAGQKRTRIKIIILAAYFHVFWQTFPVINTFLIAGDLAGVCIVLFAARLKKSKKTRKQQSTNVSLSDLWHN